MCWNKQIREKRLEYGVTQDSLSRTAGITRAYYNTIERGSQMPSAKLKSDIEKALEKHNSQYDMYVLFDYVRIRFPTQDIRYIVEDILKMQLKYFFCEDHAFYGYREQYLFGSICIMISDEGGKRGNLGTLLELKGIGCREFEAVLETQKRSWFDFFSDCIKEFCVFKRLDLAINDTGGILSVPELIAKCENEQCKTIFKKFQTNTSGEMSRKESNDGKLGMGNTLYLGSMKSEIYICFYEKDYEQYIKEGIPIEDAEVKNRCEIRLKNDRAKMAVEDLLSDNDVEKTAFDIINYYVCFLDSSPGKDQDDWEINYRWQWFMGRGRGKLRLTMMPKPYDLESSYRWVINQVIPTLKALIAIDIIKDRNTLNQALREAEIPKKLQKLIEQMDAPLDDVIINDLPVDLSGLHVDKKELYDLRLGKVADMLYEQLTV